MDMLNLKTFNGTPIEDIFRKLPPVNEHINAENIEIFSNYETMDSSELRHKCVLCGKDVDIDGSISSKGHRLICINCVYRYFEGDYSAVFMWNRRGKSGV